MNVDKVISLSLYYDNFLIGIELVFYNMVNVQLLQKPNGIPVISLMNHLRYIEKAAIYYDPSQGFFDQTKKVERYSFVNRLQNQRNKPQHSPGYRLLISFEEADLQTNLTDVIRMSLLRLQKVNNLTLDWIGIFHMQEDNLHAHIIIRGFDFKNQKIILTGSHVSHLKKLITEKISSDFQCHVKERKIANYFLEKGAKP
ncbi:hypothetical protein EPH95_16005 [Salicibibacter halophilus]|uniref:Uncharacterized protein n=1 Tax=Salicibibacter halophilus TaxID=2502791 RepID=A0A514LKY3_9BACI|nr:hypothetical protein [Salicibibacter halophilus]QDI92507.1 hypothetical protein EPH95_16005 [Salicibibacter halophilus]